MKEMFENLKSVLVQCNRVIEQYLTENKFSEEQAIKALYEKSDAVQIMYESGFISEKEKLQPSSSGNSCILSKITFPPVFHNFSF